MFCLGTWSIVAAGCIRAAVRPAPASGLFGSEIGSEVGSDLQTSLGIESAFGLALKNTRLTQLVSAHGLDETYALAGGECSVLDAPCAGIGLHRNDQPHLVGRAGWLPVINAVEIAIWRLTKIQAQVFQAPCTSCRFGGRAC